MQYIDSIWVNIFIFYKRMGLLLIVMDEPVLNIGALWCAIFFVNDQIGLLKIDSFFY